MSPASSAATISPALACSRASFTADAEDAEPRQQPADAAAVGLGEGFEPHPCLQEPCVAFGGQRLIAQRRTRLLDTRAPCLADAHAPRALDVDADAAARRQPDERQTLAHAKC